MGAYVKDVYAKWGSPTKKLRRLLMYQQEGKCFDCGIFEWKDLNRTFDIHRLKKDGPYHPENCILLCRKCHHARHKED